MSTITNAKNQLKQTVEFGAQVVSDNIVETVDADAAELNKKWSEVAQKVMQTVKTRPVATPMAALPSNRNYGTFTG